jgi:hypothetical protein
MSNPVVKTQVYGAGMATPRADFTPSLPPRTTAVYVLAGSNAETGLRRTVVFTVAPDAASSETTVTSLLLAQRLGKPAMLFPGGQPTAGAASARSTFPTKLPLLITVENVAAMAVLRHNPVEDASGMTS